MLSTTTWKYDAVMEPVIMWFNCLLDHKGFDWLYSVRSVWQIHNNYIFLSRFAEQRRKWQTLTSIWPSKLYSILKLIQNAFQIICSTLGWCGPLCHFFTFLRTLKSKLCNQIVNCQVQSPTQKWESSKLTRQSILGSDSLMPSSCSKTALRPL